MKLEMVLNERSLDNPAPNIPTAQQWMLQLINTIRAAKKVGISTLRTHRDLNGALLAESYSIGQWRNDRTVDREAQRFFKLMQTRSPFIDSLTEPDLEEQNARSEFFCNDLVVWGIGIAVLLDSLVLSLPSAPQWETPHVTVQHHVLDEVAAEIICLEIEFPQISQPSHLVVHETWIDDRTRFSAWSVEDEILTIYKTQDGKKPIANWLDSLKTQQTRNLIESRLSQAKRGNLGDYRQLTDQDGVIELRIFFGPGYRIYCGRLNDSQIIVLWAGDKSTQIQDIATAKNYWKDWKKRHNLI
jgi:putative addiction module killer protein